MMRGRYEERDFDLTFQARDVSSDRGKIFLGGSMFLFLTYRLDLLDVSHVPPLATRNTDKEAAKGPHWPL